MARDRDVTIRRAVVEDALIILRAAARRERPNSDWSERKTQDSREPHEAPKATYCPGCEEPPDPAYHTSCVPKPFRRGLELDAAKFGGGPGPRPCDGSCNPGGRAVRLREARGSMSAGAIDRAGRAVCRCGRPATEVYHDVRNPEPVHYCRDCVPYVPLVPHGTRTLANPTGADRFRSGRDDD
jgi:hypothetical protein